MESPLDPATTMLLSEDPADRDFAVKTLGMRGEHLDLLAVIASNDSSPFVGIGAAAWLGINGYGSWIDHLSWIASSSTDPAIRRVAGEARFFAIEGQMARREQAWSALSRVERLKRRWRSY